jgi:hypothetical protein
MSSSLGRSASTGPMASSTAAHGGSTGPCARPRRMRGGSGAATTRSNDSSRNRVTPMPALPATSTVDDRPPAAALIASPIRARSGSRPTNRRLTTLPGISAL